MYWFGSSSIEKKEKISEHQANDIWSKAKSSVRFSQLFRKPLVLLWLVIMAVGIYLKNYYIAPISNIGHVLYIVGIAYIFVVIRYYHSQEAKILLSGKKI